MDAHSTHYLGDWDITAPMEVDDTTYYKPENWHLRISGLITRRHTMARASIKIDSKSNTITIVMPLTPRISASGKMLLLTDTGGNQETEATYEHEGKTKPVYANINIGIYATDKAPKG